VTDTIPLGIIVAVLGGMAIGVERQWSGHATGPQARFAGIRTFSLLGGVAGISGWLWSSNLQALAVVLLAAAAILVLLAYVAASRIDVDATTEVSALVVLGAGVVAGIGQLTLASAAIAVTAFFLIEKSRLHSLVARLDDAALRAAARFAVMAVVVLPLLPQGPFGPWDAVRPRELWMLVLFCSGLSFAGYVARRSVGDTHGYPLAGLFGGLISSTNVTLTFARASRATPRLRLSLAFGVIAACTVLFLRVGIVTLALNQALARAVAWYLIAPFGVGLAILAWGLRDSRDDGEPLEAPRNPLQLGSAIQMAVVFQGVLIAVELVQRSWGDPGVILSGAVLGLTDIDALTISMARGAAADIPVDVAARAVAVGILANTALKLAVVLVVGVSRFRALGVPALAAMAVASAASIALLP
jgi:uncharacterized membrane protein (DUF4010 family)